MTALASPKLRTLLEAYDNKLEALLELLVALEAVGLITVKRREVIRARALVQKHISALDADTFGRKDEKALIHQIDDSMEISSFDIDTAFENPRGPALKTFRAVSTAWDAVHNYVFVETEPDDEAPDDDE